MGSKPRDAIVLASLVSLPFVALFAHSQVIIPIGLLALMGGWVLWEDRRDAGSRGDPYLILPSRPSVLFMVGVAFPLWALVTLAWSPSPTAGARGAISMVVIALGGVLCVRCLNSLSDPIHKRRLVGLLSAAVLAGATVVILEALSGGLLLPLIKPSLLSLEDRVSSLNSGVIIGFLLAWVLVMGALEQGRRPLAGGLAVGMVLMVFLSNSESAKAALIMAISTGVASLLLGRWALRLVFLGYGMVLVLTPFVFRHILTDTLFREMAPSLPFSLQHRFIMWRHVSEWVFEHPILGWGIGSSRSFEHERVVRDFFLGEFGWVQKSLQVMPIHPHNASLQIWLDLGVVGLVIVILFLFLSLAFLERRERSRWHQAGVTGLTAGGLVVTLGTFSMWQGWLMASAALVGCLSWMLLKDRESASQTTDSPSAVIPSPTTEAMGGQ
ncbi:MAG: O-antigen ligase family protein [Rhodospirillum sp.]|nr:O-antigen ligase family protein [Rhodospirillum sp.]MCF8488133.1 O-antigen ligase family protein [Rhodospirillum sp.]MCF8499975.1 O-antigen ligase family protein [Rhodospirillum sp.]